MTPFFLHARFLIYLLVNLHHGLCCIVSCMYPSLRGGCVWYQELNMT